MTHYLTIGENRHHVKALARVHGVNLSARFETAGEAQEAAERATFALGHAIFARELEPVRSRQEPTKHSIERLAWEPPHELFD